MSGSPIIEPVYAGTGGGTEDLPSPRRLPRWLGGGAACLVVAAALTGPTGEAVAADPHCPAGVPCATAGVPSELIDSAQARFPATRLGAAAAWVDARTGAPYWQQVQLITMDRGSVALVERRTTGAPVVAAPPRSAGDGPVTVTARRGGWLLTVYLVAGMSGDLASVASARRWALTAPLPP